MTEPVKDYDGLCGVIYRWSTSDQQVCCKYEFGHTGIHSWEKLIPDSGCCSISGPDTISHPIESWTQIKK